MLASLTASMAANAQAPANDPPAPAAPPVESTSPAPSANAPVDGAAAADKPPAPAQPSAAPPPWPQPQPRTHVVLVHLESRATVLEAELDEVVALTVVPGDYDLVWRRGDVETRRTLNLEPGQSTEIAAARLRVTATALPTDSRFANTPPVLSTTLPKGVREFRVFLGGATNRYRTNPASSEGLGGLSFAWGITDRLELLGLAPVFGWSLGRRGPLEGLVWGGVVSWGAGFSSIEKLIATADLGLGVSGAYRLSRVHALHAGLGATSRTAWSSLRREPPDTWLMRGSAGYSRTFADVVTVNAGAALTRNVLWHGRLPRADVVDESQWGFALGGAHAVGSRAARLVQVHVTERFTLEASYLLEWNAEGRASTVLGGFAFDF